MADVWRDKQLTLSVDETYVDSFHPYAKNAPQIAIAAHRLTDAKLALGFHSGFTIALWGKNLFNEIYHTYAYNEPSIESVTGGPPYGFFYGDPRTYGLSLAQHF
jgi:iron complex outermembrane recepter protein